MFSLHHSNSHSTYYLRDRGKQNVTKPLKIQKSLLTGLVTDARSPGSSQLEQS